MKFAITGYASLDYAVRLDRASEPDHTATILSRPPEWPRLGGSPAYVAVALTAAGAKDVTPISWVGDDAAGETYLAALAAHGVAADGVSRRPGRTPVCILAYEPDGGCRCLYDPGLRSPGEIDDDQRALVSAADCLCLTIGPAEATRASLRLARADAKVVWAVKADPRAAPPDLVAELAVRADVIVHNRGEAALVAEALAVVSPRPGQFRIETRGREGVAAFGAAGGERVGAEPVDCDDTTGAGDTFLGGFLAALFERGEPLRDALMAGDLSARQLLEARTRASQGQNL